MQRLTEVALEHSVGGVFTRTEVACWVGGSPDRQFSLLKRALASGEVVRIHRGLYCLAVRSSRQKPDPLALAQRIHGPSYISLETALSWHGWIPEAVYTTTSVCLDRSHEISTPLGHFSFTRVPQQTLYLEVERVPGPEGSTFLVASPLKALADYVYVHRCNWRSLQPLVASLRIEEDSIRGLDRAAFDPLRQNYRSLRVKHFLDGLQKELGP